MKKKKQEKIYYMVSLNPRFRMPEEMVKKFKKRGYKWVMADRWNLEKKDFTSEKEEREFINSFGEQKWEFSILPDVGKYDEECEQCGYKKTIILYDPLLITGLQGIDRCPKCKEYSLQVKNIETNERFKEWEKEAERASEAFIDLIKGNSDEK